MAEAILSPGVYLSETDRSFIQPEPIATATAFVGPTVKGPVEVPTIITSFAQYQNEFGTLFTSGSEDLEYLTSMAVKYFFDQGGSTALITRVTSGSFTSATSTDIENIGSTGTSPFVLETLGAGEIYNSTGSESPAGFLENGAIDNVRWEIANVNENRGTFTVLIRRGDDNAKNRVVLETFADVSLDPKSDNYIKKVIGDRKVQRLGDPGDYYIGEVGEFRNRSRFVRVSEVNTPTINYLDNEGNVRDAANTDLLPVAQSGSFGGAIGTLQIGTNYYNGFTTSDTQGLSGSDYDIAFQLLQNKDEYKFNVIIAPGLIGTQHPTQIESLISLVETRGDSITVVDLSDFGAKIDDAVEDALVVNSSYAATYWPYLQLRSGTGKNVYVPSSVVVPGIYAFTDNLEAPWFAPAGMLRGGLPGVIQAERKLTKPNRDTLYEGNVNPIATFPGAGVTIFGQKTLQKRRSALDRINVRRLLIEIKDFFSEQARNLVFQQNTIATRNNFLARVNPFMESVIQRQGLFSYRIVMDESNNTPDMIDRNMLVGQIFIQPSRTVEFVVFDFTIEPTGATVEG